MKSMKIRLLMVSCLGILAGAPSLTWGILPPAQPPLPNFDKRSPLSVTRAEAEGRAQALARLRQQLPQASVDRDRILGTPSFITTPRGFLTSPVGERSVVAAAVGVLPANDPHRMIKAFIDDHADLFGHTSDVLDRKSTRL